MQGSHYRALSTSTDLGSYDISMYFQLINQVMRAYSTSTTTLRALLSNPLLSSAHVEKTTENLAEALADQEEIDQATADFLLSSPRLEAIKEQIEATDIPGAYNLVDQAKAVASEVAAFTLNVSKASSDGERKRSITTQDFLNEAMHIMSIIRARGSRPQSGLGMVEESNEDGVYGQHLQPEDIDMTRSSLRLSRPPSREGRESGWRPRSQQQHDPSAINQLRKFEETGEIDIVDTTLRGLHIHGQNGETLDPQEINRNAATEIRIRGPSPEAQRERGSSDASEPRKDDSFKTNLSADFSTGRTLGSNSTRKSDNVATLAPETVAHLIPEEVAGMTFDRTQGRWIRLKGSKVVSRIDRASPVPSSNMTSDDDPFDLIPDLTVDEVKEMGRIQSARSSQHFAHQDEVSEINDFVPPLGRGASESRPTTRDTHATHPFSSSSRPSRYSAFASSQPQPETRATSYSNGELMYGTKLEQHKITSFGSYEKSDPFDLAEQYTDKDELEDSEISQGSVIVAEDAAGAEESDVEEVPIVPQHQLPYASSPLPAYRNVTHGLSLRRQTLHRAYQTTCREQSEMSILAELPDKRLMSVSVSVSRPPLPSAQPSQELQVHSPLPVQRDCLLSDLPDFTVHETDEFRPSEKALASRVAQHAVDAIGDRYALAIQNIVKTLTDVEPDEPFWEDIKRLKLSGRDLGSLHGLDDFCVRLQELDLSRNSLTQLEGAPSSVRWLNASSNGLSSLTAWGHLANLQHLDISNNDIDSLDGLGNLIHLRELRVDNNHISSLDGIMDLDGLLKLSAKHNQLTEVDFQPSQL